MKNNDKRPICGSLELLDELRQSQNASKQTQDEQQQGSRLKKYISDSKKSSKNHLRQPKKNNLSSEEITLKKNEIHEIDPFLIKRWEEKDRPENELGNIEDLAKTFKSVGQLTPCIIRTIKDKHYTHELIVGECRWQAAKLAKIPLKVIIKNIDDHLASLMQAVENEKRNDLSEYAKGMSYARKIDKGLLSHKDLVDILGISKQQVSRLLSFNRIPTTLINEISDFRKVSARTAEEISRLSAKGEKYIEALATLAPKIRTGKFGGTKIVNAVMKLIDSQKTQIQSNQKVCSDDGRHLFTWRLDNNEIPSIHFPKNINQLINSGKIDFDSLTQEIKMCIAKKLSELTE